MSWNVFWKLSINANKFNRFSNMKVLQILICCVLASGCAPYRFYDRTHERAIAFEGNYNTGDVRVSYSIKPYAK